MMSTPASTASRASSLSARAIAARSSAGAPSCARSVTRQTIPRSRRILASSHGEQPRQIHEAGDQVHDAKTADTAAHEVARHQRLQLGPRRHEIVAIPEAGPWEDDQQQSDFEEERHVDESPDQTITLAPGLWSIAGCAATN